MSPTYPKRPHYFACQFCRLLTKKCVANEHGCQAFTLLTVIAMTEDARGYTDPVTFFNGQLFPLVGLGSEDALDRVRKRCIEAGWLHYVPGGRRIGPGRYWVTVPERYQGTDDAPTDEGVEFPVLLRACAEQSAEQEGLHRTHAVQTESKAGGKPRANRGTFLPIPVPKKDPPSPPLAGGDPAPPKKWKSRSSSTGSHDAPDWLGDLPPVLDTAEFRAAWSEWEQHRREIKKHLTPRSVAQQLKQLAEMGPVRASRCIQHSIRSGWRSLHEAKSQPEPNRPATTGAAQQCRAPTTFEVRHCNWSSATGYERDANGNLKLDRMCDDPACDHCAPRRMEGSK